MGSNISQQAKDSIYACKKDGGKELNLSNCELQGVPAKVLKFKKLKRLNISRNMIQVIPPEVSKFPLLEELDANSNEIVSVPAEVGNLENLSYLDLSNNSLSEIPALPTKSLKVLKISLNNMPHTELNLPLLTELQYARNHIVIFPMQLLQLQHLVILNLSGNKLNYLPDEIHSLVGLEVLDISENMFSSFPPPVKSLTNLKTLDIGKNLLNSITLDVLALVHLEVLRANNCKLSELGVDIGVLDHLVELNLRENNIGRFSPEFVGGLERLTNLKVLDLAMNALTSLPRQFGYLLQLRKLVLNNNNIKSLPGELSLLSPSIDMTISANPLEHYFAQYVKDGIPILFDKLQPYIGAFGPKCYLLEDVSEVPSGKPMQCTLQSIDFKGRPRITGGDVFEAFLKTEEGTRVDAYIKSIKETPGIYSLFFNTPKSGHYILSVTFEGRHITGSPFSVNAQ